ncbi:MAG: restriction endonuclease subunit S, partial [Cyanobacteriota bacterium]
MITLFEVATWGSGGTPSRKNPEFYGGSIPWVKTGELGPRLLSETEEAISELGLAHSSAKVFPPGSIAVAMYGATIGKASILGIAAATNQACAVATVDPLIAHKEFLFH